MKWRATAAILVIAVVVGLAAGMVAALWTGTQTTSGDVSATSGSPDLYICEPNADPLNPDCGPDDSGADETIFEGTEELLPGGHVWAPVRLKNLSETEPLKILGTTVTVGGATPDDCDEALWDELQKSENVSVWILGKWADLADIPREPGEEFEGMAYSPSDVLTNDNYPAQEGYELQVFQPTLVDGVYPGWPKITKTVGEPPDEVTMEDFESPYRVDYGSKWAVHIAPGDYEDMAIRVRLPYDLPTDCEGNVWNISIDWEVVSTVDWGNVVVRQEGEAALLRSNMFGGYLVLQPGEVQAITGLAPGDYWVEEMTVCQLVDPGGVPLDYIDAWCDGPSSWWSFTGAYDCSSGPMTTCCWKINIDLGAGRSLLCTFSSGP